jgi:hypothetical protein
VQRKIAILDTISGNHYFGRAGALLRASQSDPELEDFCLEQLRVFKTTRGVGADMRNLHHIEVEKDGLLREEKTLTQLVWLMDQDERTV